MDKQQECVNEALPCAHCGSSRVVAQWIPIGKDIPDPNFYGNLGPIYEYAAGRFYCPICGASTKFFALILKEDEEEEMSDTWEDILAAWNIRAPTVSGHAAPSPAPRPRPEPRENLPRAPRAPSPSVRAKPEKPSVSSRVNPLLVPKN